MILSDRDLRIAIREGNLVIDPAVPPAHVQPASIDLTLGREWARFRETGARAFDLVDPAEGRVPEMRTFTRDSYALAPGAFVLGTTAQVVGLGRSLLGRVEGKSTLGRLGLFVHITAGFIDPGFKGNVTLEFFNASPLPIKLTAGMKICQLAVSKMYSPPERIYGDNGLGSHYQGQEGATPARIDQ